MNIGTIAFATDQGLGYLAKDFYDHGIVTHPMLLSHGRRPDHFDWYPDGTERLPTHRGERSIEAFKQYLSNKSIDRMLFFETPFNWDFIRVCREAGVKSFLMPMHECMPAVLPDKPDVWLCPSDLDSDWAFSHENGKTTPPTLSLRLDVPVPDWVPYRQRERARVFVHNAGNGGLKGRNGTEEVIRAWRLLNSEAKLILRAQDASVLSLASENKNITIVPHHVPAEELYAEGDVFLFPERFNGLSLPLQEARAAGMLVMCGNRFPMNRWLPTEPLIPVHDYTDDRCAGHLASFVNANIRPQDIAKKVDFYFDSDISTYSRTAIDWRECMSWERLKPEYLKVLEAK